MSNVLQGQTRQGDFVHQTQGTAVEQGFKCVSRGWFPQTKPISTGIDQLLDDARKREDFLCPMKHMVIGVNDAGQLVLEYLDGREFTFTEHALNQFSLIANVPITFTNAMTNPVVTPNGKIKFERDSGDMQTLVNVFKNGLRHNDPDKEYRFRTYTDGTLRAVLSSKYAIVNNVWYLETLAELFKQIGGDEPRLSHWRGDADTIYGNILIPDTCRADKDSDYGGMISVSNCEIGIRRLSQFPSIFRAICMNGCIWDRVSGININKVHRGAIDLNDLRTRIATNIHTQIPLLDEGVKKFLALRDMVVAKDVQFSNIFAMIAKENQMTFGATGQAATMVKQYLDHEQDNRNLFGIVNAITRTGQLYSPAEWVRFDSIAGKYMGITKGQWEGLQMRAKGMDKKDHDKVFGLVAA